MMWGTSLYNSPPTSRKKWCTPHVKHTSKKNLRLKPKKVPPGKSPTPTKLTPSTTHHHRGSHHHTHHTRRLTSRGQHTCLLIMVTTTHTLHTILYPKLKISRDFSNPLKKLLCKIYLIYYLSCYVGQVHSASSQQSLMTH